MAVETGLIPEMTFKVNMQHHRRFPLKQKIGLSDDPNVDIFSSRNITIKDFYTFNQVSGAIPMRGNDNYDPIELCFEVPQAEFTTKKYFYIVQDLFPNDLDPSVVPVGFVPQILDFELIDERYKQFNVKCNESNVEIADNGTTALSIIYDVFLENEITTDATLSNNIGIPYGLNITPGLTLTISNNAKLYFHDSGINNTAGNILIEENASLIGFAENTEDVINIENAYLTIGKSLFLKNCNLIIGDASTLILNDNAEIVVSEGSELVISPIATIIFGIGSKISIEKGGKLTLSDNTILTVTNQSQLKISDTESDISFGLNSGIKFINNSIFTIGDDYELIVESGLNLNIAAGTTITLGVGAKITLKSGITLTIDGVTINGTSWAGINAEAGSSIIVNNSHFNGAQTVISAYNAYCSVSNSVFTDCRNGIDLIASNSYTLTANTFTGDSLGT
ncbi:MAG: hypothetical protein KKD38_07170, partial [Candidatus Delongbacteria bacterium]|nr:hypothetical protein [Candidatus Delongbacteria bacterium]